MRRKHEPRMLAKARGKYGKPSYPGRKVKAITQKEKVENDVCGAFRKETINNIDENVRKVWDVIKETAREDVSPVSFETWIEPCKPLKIVDGKIVLMVENDFVKEMLEKRYVAFLQRVGEKVTNQNSVKIVVITMQE